MIKENETGFIIVGSVGTEIEAAEISFIAKVFKTGIRIQNLNKEGY